mgnify:FL=1
MPKYSRVKKIILMYLIENGSANTRKIYEHVNERSKTGITTRALVNVLSKHLEIEKVNQERVNGNTGSYELCVWRYNGNS